MVDVARARRLAGRIREVVAYTLEMQVKDPRLGMVTITDARVTPDLREATVYYTVYGDDEARTGSAVALESAKGVVRSAVGRQTGVKFTPTLTFVADVVPETARHLADLVAKVRAEDSERARAAAGAMPAGDPDPYRVPRTAGDDEEDDMSDEPGSDYTGSDYTGTDGTGTGHPGWAEPRPGDPFRAEAPAAGAGPDADTLSAAEDDGTQGGTRPAATHPPAPAAERGAEPHTAR